MDMESVRLLTWKQVRDAVTAVNPSFAAQIDQLDPSDDLKLVRAQYRYGDTILANSDLYLPHADGGVIKLKDASVSKALQDALIMPASMPMGLTLDKSIEIDVATLERVIPFGVIKPGSIFALWDVLRDPSSFSHMGRDWRITAGAHSIAMLPKISDIANFRKLKQHFNIPGNPPKDQFEQFSVFKELLNSKQVNSTWTVDVLFFSNDWIDKLDDPAWKNFRGFLYELGWNNTQFLRDQIVFDAGFADILIKKNLKPSPYLLDTVKHLYSLAAGYYPGFQFANEDNMAPISLLQNIFVEIYGLKYMPSLFQPGYLSADKSSKPLYYSLQWPTTMAFSPKSDRQASKLVDLRDIQHMLAVTVKEIMHNHIEITDCLIYKAVDDIAFSYFHYNEDKYNSVASSEEMLTFDTTLQAQQRRFNLPFCASSALVRGCIAISHKL